MQIQNAILTGSTSVYGPITIVSGSLSGASVSASYVSTLSQSLFVSGALNVTGSTSLSGSVIVSGSISAFGPMTASAILSAGTITAQTLVVQTITSSIEYSSGSNIFGSQLNNNQTFTGSVNITGSLALAGNAGIGVTNPYVKLDVRGGGIGQTTTDFVASSAGSVIYMRTGATTGNTTYGLIQVGNTGDTIGGNLILNQYGGNVGIGTTSPAVSLDISGSGIRVINPSAPIIYLNNTTVQWKTYLPASSNNFAINDAVRDVLTLGYNGAASYFQGGNVGIGTTTPTSGSLQIFNSNGTNHIALNGGSYPNTYLGSFSGGTYFANNYFYAPGHASDDATKRSMEFFMGQDEIDINTMPAGSPGTRTRVMTISGSQGYIGIGNITPQYTTQITNTSANAVTNILALHNASNAAGTGTGARLLFKLANFETSAETRKYASIEGISVSSYNEDIDLVFKTKSSNADPTERMRITSGGNLLQGYLSTTAAYEHAIYGAAGSNTWGSSSRFSLYDNATAGQRAWSLQIDGSTQLRTFYYNGSTWSTNGYQTTGGTWTNSDERRKTNIEDLEYGLNEILQLIPKKFNFKHDIEGGNIRQKDMGFIAQEVLPIMPLAVDTYIDGEQEYYSMNYANIIPTLVKAVQELKAENDGLITRIQALENK